MTTDHAAWIKARRRELRHCFQQDPVHISVHQHLERQTGERWAVQVPWGFRFLDFFVPERRVAVMLDAPYLDRQVIAALDAYDLRRSGIRIYHVPRGDFAALDAALVEIKALPLYAQCRPPPPRQWPTPGCPPPPRRAVATRRPPASPRRPPDSVTHQAIEGDYSNVYGTCQTPSCPNEGHLYLAAGPCFVCSPCMTKRELQIVANMEAGLIAVKHTWRRQKPLRT